MLLVIFSIMVRQYLIPVSKEVAVLAVEPVPSIFRFRYINFHIFSFSFAHADGPVLVEYSINKEPLRAVRAFEGCIANVLAPQVDLQGCLGKAKARAVWARQPMLTSTDGSQQLTPASALFVRHHDIHTGRLTSCDSSGFSHFDVAFAVVRKAFGNDTRNRCIDRSCFRGRHSNGFEKCSWKHLKPSHWFRPRGGATCVPLHVPAA